MRLTSFVVSRSWASNPLRTALTVLGIGLGVAIVVAIHIMDHNTIRSRLMEQRPQRGAVELELHAVQRGRSPEAVRRDLEHRDGIEAVALWLEADVRVGGHAAGLYGLDPLPGGLFSHYRVQEGEDLGGDGGDGEAEVLMGIELAEVLGVGPGDAVELESGGPRTVCRDGVPQAVAAETPVAPVSVRVRGILAYELLGRRDLGQVIVGSHSLARMFAPESETLYQVARVYGADLDGLRAELEEDYLVLDRQQASIGEAADERAFRNGVKVLGCLALILGMFVVFQTLSQSLVERLSQIGLLRCLGASRRTIAGIFLVDALSMAVVGTVLGVGGGVLFALVLRSQQISSLGMLKPWLTFELPVVPILWTAALGVLFTLAGAAFPLWKARGLPPLSALGARGLDPGEQGSVLRGVNLFLFVLLVLLLPLGYLAMTPLVTEQGWETVVVLLQMGGMILVFGLVLLASPRMVSVLGAGVLLPLRRVLPLVTFLMVKTLRRNPGRIAASVCGLSVVLLALVSLKSITYALRGEVRAFATTALDQRLFLETGAVTPERASLLEQVPGVAAVDPLEGRVQAPFPLSGLAVEALTREGGVLEAYPEQADRYRNERCLLVSPRLAKLRGLGEGDAVSVVTDRGPVPYSVLRVTDRAGFVPDERAWAVAAPRWLRQDFCVPESSVRQISLALLPGVPPDEVQRAAAAILPVQGAKTGEWIRDYHLRDVSRDFFIFDILLAAILVLAMAGLVNSMTIAALGRVREIGVIRALGLGRRDLRRLFLIEGVLVALVSTLFVLALGVPMGQLVVSGLNRVARLEAPFAVPWVWLAVVPILALAAGVGASVLPGLRACRQDPAASVRYE